MQRNLDVLGSETFDVLVIGGGIVGACVARDAALRGLHVALIEKGDFAAGTSANSLKIVHGGLRYLQHLDFRRMRQSIRERSTWLRVAPHLIEPLPVLIPTHGFGTRGRAILRTALMVNDAVGYDRNKHLLPGRSLPPGRAVSRQECIDLIPELVERPISGGVLFFDAQMYSSERLVLEVLQGACDAGAVIANYVEAKAPLRSGGRMIGAEAQDLIGNQELEIQAKVILNVAGPAAVSLAARFTKQPRPIKTTLSTAMNFVIVGSNHRVAFAVTGSSHDPNVLVHRGGRQLFITPWRGHTLIGTAHYAYNGDPERFDLDERDVERFLEEVNMALPDRNLAVGDISLVHRGLLPALGTGEPVRLAKHPIVVDHAASGEPNLISALTVKFTTARFLAEQVINLACARLGRPRLACTTSTTPLPGAPSEPVDELARKATERWRNTLEPDVTEHLVRTYGQRYEAVLDHCKTDRDWDRRLAEGSPVIKAQVIHALRHEMAYCTDDVIARRTELGALGIRSDRVVEEISRIVEAERKATAA